MVPILALWLPIVLAAVLVFVASSVIHMLLGYHAGDFSAAPNEDRVMEAMRGAGIKPGEYVMPYAGSMKAMSDPAFVAKQKAGPVAMLTVLPSGPPSMARSLVLWFIYAAVVGVFAAYVTGRALGPGAEYMAVFRISGTVAFVGYVLALWQGPVWFGRKWSTTLKNTFDGLVYALLTAGAFGWLWP